MSSKINVKARIKRQLRIAKQNFGKKSTKQILGLERSQSQLYIVLMLLVLFPFYPKISEKVYGNITYSEFDRKNIDETSILESYYWWDEIEDENAPLFESADSFISVNTILNDERNLEGTNEIINYEVRPGDSFYGISYKFKVSTNSIYWANNFSKSHVLRPREVIKIPPVSGLIHQVKKWESLGSIAKKYDIEQEKIREQNLLSKNETIPVGEVLVIPGAVKKVIKPVIKRTPTKTYTSTSKWYSFAKYADSSYTEKGGKYNLVWRKPYSGQWGNCTWYVASYKNVNWRGNANQWLRNARAKWHATGSTPKIGSIVAFQGRGYNPRYGHVWIVMDVKWGYIYVSDMNYRKLNEVTYRKVPVNSSSITWYIYVD